MFKKLIVFGLKCTIAFGLLYWLYVQNLLDLSPVSQIRFDRKFLAILLVSAAFVLGALILLAYRLLLLLNPQGVTIPFIRALALTMLGALFGIVLPGLIGGDVIKAAYLFGDSPGFRSRVMATVIVDRLLGLYGLFLLSTMASMVAWTTNFVPDSPEILLVGPGLTLFATLGCFFFFGLTRIESQWLCRWVVWVPPQILNVLNALAQYWEHPGPLILAIGISVLSHALIVGTFVFGAIIISDGLPLYIHFIVDPMAMVLNIVPLTPGGLGVTESAFSYLFEMLGSSNGSLVGLLGRCIQYMVFVIGGIIALMATRISWSCLGQGPVLGSKK